MAFYYIFMTKHPERKKKNSKIQLVMEWTWLVIAIFSLTTWIYTYIRERNSVNNMLLVISGVSFLMFVLRKQINKNLKS